MTEDRPLNLQTLERWAILTALGQTGHRQDLAALKLGISARVLDYKMIKHGIPRLRDRREDD